MDLCARFSAAEGAVLALGSVATRNLEPWTVYGGIPARRIKTRQMQVAREFASLESA